MRKLELQVQLSVDGFIAGFAGQMDWLTFAWTDDIKQYVDELMRPVDTILLGRKLVEGFIPHWASIPDAPGADQINNAHKVVFTSTLAESVWNNTVLAKGQLVDEVGALNAYQRLTLSQTKAFACGVVALNYQTGSPK